MLLSQQIPEDPAGRARTAARARAGGADYPTKALSVVAAQHPRGALRRGYSNELRLGLALHRSGSLNLLLQLDGKPNTGHGGSVLRLLQTVLRLHSLDAALMGVGVSDGTRTRDVLDHNQVLYQLSYTHHAPSGTVARNLGD